MKSACRVFWLCSALVVAVYPAFSQKPASLLGHAHAHNDYEHDRPLLDALDNGFHSVEADVWLVDGTVEVAHDKGDWRGSLAELYLDPLAKRIAEKGSVHGDGRTFFLWVDLKQGGSDLQSALHSLLEAHSFLTRFSPQGIDQGPVTVILTGSAEAKEAMVRDHETRPYCRDSNNYSTEDPTADNRWLWYALRWWNHFQWTGEEPMPEEDLTRLKGMVEDIHSKGRRVRFYSIPDEERVWGTLLEAGVDHINTDDLEGLSGFLRKTEESE